MADHLDPLRRLLEGLRENRNTLIETMAQPDPNIDEVPGLREQMKRVVQHLDVAVREVEAALELLESDR